CASVFIAAVGPPARAALFPYTTLFRSPVDHGRRVPGHEPAPVRARRPAAQPRGRDVLRGRRVPGDLRVPARGRACLPGAPRLGGDRKSTRLNSSHVAISYAAFGLKKNT